MEAYQNVTVYTYHDIKRTFDYEMFLEGKRIFPDYPEDNNTVHCLAYRSNRLGPQHVGHHRVGHIYHYMRFGEFYVSQPFQLRSALSWNNKEQNFACKVIIPPDGAGVENEENKNICICQREKDKQNYEINKKKS